METDGLAGYRVGQTVITNVDGLPGRVAAIVPPTEALPRPGFEATPAYLSVDVFIPRNHPGFMHAGQVENFWLLPEEVSFGNTL